MRESRKLSCVDTSHYIMLHLILFIVESGPVYGDAWMEQLPHSSHRSTFSSFTPCCIVSWNIECQPLGSAREMASGQRMTTAIATLLLSYRHWGKCYCSALWAVTCSGTLGRHGGECYCSGTLGRHWGSAIARHLVPSRWGVLLLRHIVPLRIECHCSGVLLCRPH